MMQAVVTGGTGTAAQIPGVRVAGKTGTAETGKPGRRTRPGSSRFAPADHPRYAVAVVLENQTAQTGGEVAAPIAKTIMRSPARPERLPNLSETAVATFDTLIDTLFDGRYRIDPQARARAGWPTSTWPRTRSSGRRVAIKILDERHAQDEQFVERFRREAKSAAGLSHPNIVSIYDRGEAEGTYYIAMEYLEGNTLKELLVSRGPTPVRVAIDYTRQILAALELRAPERHRPPRHQAAQRPRRARRPAEGDGLRHRPLRRRAR